MVRLIAANLLVLGLSTASVARAGLLTEDMAYTTNNAVDIQGNVGGSGWGANAWAASSGSRSKVRTNHIEYASGGYAITQQPFGTTNSGTFSGEYNAYRGATRTVGMPLTNAVWFSAVMLVGAGNQGYVGFNSGQSASFAYAPSTTYTVGISNGVAVVGYGGTTSSTWTEFTPIASGLNTNNTHLILGRITFRSSGTNSELKVWVDPSDLTQLGAPQFTQATKNIGSNLFNVCVGGANYNGVQGTPAGLVTALRFSDGNGISTAAYNAVTGATNPTVTITPGSPSVGNGGNITFTALTPATSYQWFFNGTSVANATNSTFSLTNVSSASRGFYSVLVSNLVGATPALASLKVTNCGLNLIWQGGATFAAPIAWDQYTTNWGLVSSPSTRVAFGDGDAVAFDDSAATNTIVISGAIYPAGMTFSNISNPYNLSGGSMGGAGQLVVAGASDVNLLLPCAYAGGTVINNKNLSGQITVQVIAGQFQGNVLFNGSRSVQLAFTLGSGTFSGNVTGTNAASIITAASTLSNYTATLSGNLSHAGSVNVNGGTLIMSGSNTYSGDTIVDNSAAISTLRIASATALPFGANAGNVVINGNTSSPLMDLNGFNASINGLAGTAGLFNGVVSNGVGNVTLTLGNNNATADYEGDMKGGVSLVKVGSGAQTLGSTNISYTGTTTVSNGTLLVNGSLNSTNAVNVSGGTLVGGGGIHGAVTVQAGGTIAPGTSAAIGTLNIYSNVTLNGICLLRLDKDFGPQNDQIAGVNTLTQGGALTVVNISTNSMLAIGDSFTLFSAGSITGSFSTVDLPYGVGWDTSQLSTTGVITVTNVYADVQEDFAYGNLAMFGNLARFTNGIGWGTNNWQTDSGRCLNQTNNLSYGSGGYNITQAGNSGTFYANYPTYRGAYRLVGTKLTNLVWFSALMQGAAGKQAYIGFNSTGTNSASSPYPSTTYSVGISNGIFVVGYGGNTSGGWSTSFTQITTNLALGPTHLILGCITFHASGNNSRLQVWADPPDLTSLGAAQWSETAHDIGSNLFDVCVGSAAATNNGVGGLVSALRFSDGNGHGTAAYTAVTGATNPTVTITPGSPSVGNGSNITFTAVTTATSYQWFSNGIPVANATNSTFSLAYVFSASRGFYSVLVSNLVGTASALAMLDVTNCALNLVWQGGATFAGPTAWGGRIFAGPTTWDPGTTNWGLVSNPSTRVAFGDGDTVTFDDTASTNVIGVNGYVNPAGMTFNNITKAYTITNAYNSSGGTIGGPGQLVVAGANDVNLLLPCAYTGGTIVANNNASGQITIRVIPGQFQGNISFNGSKTVQLAFTSGSGTFSGNVTGPNASSSITAASTLTNYTADLSGNLSHAGGINVNGGTLILSGSNTYSRNTVVNRSVLKVGSVKALPFGTGAGNVVVNGSTFASVLDLNGFSAAINGLAGTTNLFNGIVSNGVGNVTLTLGNNNATADYEGDMKGSISLVKVGSGTQTLGGASLSYTGTTTVSNGTLLVNGSLNSINAVNVSGGTLAGGGGIHGAVTVQAGGTIAPGTSAAIGTLNAYSNLALNGTCLLRLDKDFGLQNDQIAGVNTLTQGGALTVVNISTSSKLAIGDSFTLFSASSIAGSFSTMNLPYGVGWDTSHLITTGVITVTNVYTNAYVPSSTLLVGAIRWDAWQDSTTTNDGILSGVEAVLGPYKWHYRLPFFSQVTGSNSVSINGNSQSIMDQEINYAANAGLNFWAFDLYSPTSGFTAALNLYLSSTNKSRINYACIIQGTSVVTNSGSGTWSSQVTRYVNYFRDISYQKVLDGRPLVFILNPMSTNVNDAKNDISQLRAVCTNTGVGNPYIVYQDSQTGAAATNSYNVMQSYGMDALGSYGGGAGNGGTTNGNAFTNLSARVQTLWNSQKATGANVIPLVSSGFDNRPFVENPVPWYPGANLYHYLPPTSQELASQLANAISWDSINNSTNAPANIVLIYAWNEHAEGGWICPTLNTSDWVTPDTSRLDAIAAALSPHSPRLAAMPNVTMEMRPSTGGQYLLSWPQGILYETTNLSGLWTINTNTSPFSLTPTGGQKFFRVLIK